MGGAPEQPKEEQMENKEETSEKSASLESYDKAEWEKLKQGDPTLAIKKGKEMGVPEEKLRIIGEQAYESFFNSGDFSSAMRVAADLYGMDSEKWKHAAEKMTQQRRKKYGLEESKDLTPEEVEKIEADIKILLERLNEYNYDIFDPKIQDEWDWVEQEAENGKDREIARAVLERFLKVLKGKVE